MKKVIKNIFLVFLFISLGACAGYTDGINDDPNNFTDSPADLLIGQANLEVVMLHESNSARIGGMWSDQFTGSDRQYISLNNYLTTTGDYDNAWDAAYVDGLAQAKLAEEKATEDGNTILIGVAQIAQAAILGQVASLWGDVPSSEALDYGNFPNPAYDGQVSVLNTAQALLDAGISNVGSSTVADAYGTPIYVANDATWAEVAHSIKARFYLIAKDYPNALSQAKMGISSSAGDLLASHTSATGAKNLFFQFCAEQRGGYLTAIGSTLFQYVTGAKARLLATPGDAERNAVYFMGDNGDELNTGDGGIFAIDASFPIISYVETKLIEAEAAQRTSGDALTPFNDVRDELAAVYGGSFPHTTSSGNDLLMEILEEKYISLIGSLEVFSDVRRTDNALGVPIKGTNATDIPQRFLYPQVEINSNESFPGLVDLYTPTAVNQ